MDSFNQFIHSANKFFLVFLQDYLMIGFICAVLICILLIAIYIILPKRFDKMIRSTNVEIINGMTPFKTLIFICGLILIGITTAWPWIFYQCIKKEN